MAYTTQKDIKINRLNDLVSRHDKKITEQESITKFFVVIVSITLVSTLVGIAGLYINAIYQSNIYRIDKDKTIELQNDLNKNIEQVNIYKTKIEILKSKYPWIKDIN